MIQQKVRKKKKSCFNAHFQFSQSKITDDKGAYFWNKIWSLKSLPNSYYFKNG